jgi:two-component system, oxyanion-binding sensor
MSGEQSQQDNMVRLGFIPLVDAAVPIVAHELGFAAQEGVTLSLSREASWAAVRDKVAYGLLDCAHMLAGMPIAATLGIGQVKSAMIAPFSLGLGGNAVTVSNELYEAMLAADPAAMAGPRAGSAKALARVVEHRRRQGAEPLTFGVVFPVSSHNYELRCWMAAAGVDPDVDVQLVVIPPPRMVESLRSGQIAGFCVGEPWNQAAVAEGLGRIVVTKADLWPAAPEKVLGMRADWVTLHTDLLTRLLRALAAAARWADAADNRRALARLLARPEYVGADEELIFRVLAGRPLLGPGGAEAEIPDYHVFHRYAANFPWLSQAEWVVAQMKRWGQTGEDTDAGTIAARVFRPDLYRAALEPAGEAVPAEDRKDEGAHEESYVMPGVGGMAVIMAADRRAPGMG